MDGFVLAPAIETTSAFLADLDLCQARLQLDGRYPWIVLIPRRPSLTELEQLSAAERTMLMEETVRAGGAVRAICASSSPAHATPSSSSSLNSTSKPHVSGPPSSPWRGPIEKLNVGCLGNVTSQLHVHVVGRRRDDPSWPSPVWGHGTPSPLTPEVVAAARHAALPWLESPARSPGA